MFPESDYDNKKNFEICFEGRKQAFQAINQYFIQYLVRRLEKCIISTLMAVSDSASTNLKSISTLKIISWRIFKARLYNKMEVKIITELRNVQIEM